MGKPPGMCGESHGAVEFTPVSDEADRSSGVEEEEDSGEDRQEAMTPEVEEM